MDRPTVSIVVPVLNAEATLGRCLEALQLQTYPLIIETLVVDGGSEDGTRDLAASYGVQVIPNPRRIQASALNIGIECAHGDLIVRVDARTIVEPEYVQACVSALLETGAAMAGGAQVPCVAGSPVARGIALAMRGRFGGGTAAFRDPGRSGWVDTVYLGAFRREVWRAVGGYDENKSTNEDAEFAFRLRAHGGVWLDTKIRSQYMPRSSFQGVAKQYYMYGRGRGATARQHPSSVRPRQLAPLLLLASFISPPRRTALLIYVLGAICSLRKSWRVDAPAAAVAAAATPVMHVAWAFGFLRSLAG